MSRIWAFYCGKRGKLFEVCLKQTEFLARPQENAHMREVPKGPAQTGGLSFGSFPSEPQMGPGKEKYMKLLK